MKATRMTGEMCIGEVRLAAIDVGFDLRLHDIVVHLPSSFSSVGLERGSQTWLLEGDRDELVEAIRAAGYHIKLA